MSINTTHSSPLFHYLFVNRTLAIVLALLLAGVGLVGYQAMIKESLPDLDIPQALVVTFWSGASPEMVEKEVTEPLEQRIKGLKGLKHYRSGSMDSLSIVAVEFRAEVDSSNAMQELRQAVSAAEAKLPKKAEKPRIEQISIRDIPIATYALYGNLEPAEMGLAAKRLARRLSRLAGIKKVEIMGARQKIVQVRLMPERLQSLGISPAQVEAKLREVGQDIPWGRFEHAHWPYVMKLAGAFRDLTVIRDLPVAWRGERAIRLAEVAQVSHALEREYSRAAISLAGDEFKPVVTLVLYKLPGRDTLGLVERAQQLMAEAQHSADWVDGLEYRLASDEAMMIQDQLSQSLNNGWQATLIVFIVLFLLLSWREAIVAALAVPVTFLGTLAIIWALGYSFNELVIIGLILALGLLVDDFILMMEGMHEGIFMRGLNFPQAAWRTVHNYALPSFSGSVTTILVFLPLAFIGGVDGKFISLIPLTAAIALVLSYLVSLLLAIPLSGFLLKQQNKREKGLWIDRLSIATEKRLRDWLLCHAIARRRQAALMTAGAISLFGLALLAANELPNLLYPKEDGRNLGITVELPIDTPLEQTAVIGKAVGKVLREQYYLESITRTVGEKDPYAQSAISDLIVESTGAHYVGFACRLIPRSERDRLGYQYVEPLRQNLQKVLAAYPGARLFITPEIGGATNEDPIQIEISGPSIEQLRAMTMVVKRHLAQIAGVTDIRDDLGQPLTTAALIPRREVLSFYGISEPELASQMRAYMENDKVGKLRHSEVDADLDIRLGTWWRSRNGESGGPRDWEELQGLNIILSESESVPLSSLVTRRLDQIPQTIPHKEGVRTVTIKAKLETGTVNEVLGILEPQLQTMRAEWPRGYNYHFAGEKEATTETYQSTGQVFLISMLLVYAILVLLFNAFLQPILIMFSVMFGMTGVFLGFYLLNLPLSFTALVGIVTLVGINVNDVIVMIDTMNRHRRQGASVREAAAHGATDRLRPILSTTLTTTAGLIPLGLSEPGWMPLCVAVISGELVATVMSILFIPGLYVLVTRDTAKGDH